MQFYTDRLEPLTFRGKSEKALVLRRGKSMAPKTIADGKIIMRPDIEIDLLYRIRLNGRNYNVDTAKYVNLLEVQVSEDNR